MFTGIVEEVGVVSNIKGSLLCLKAKTVLGGMRLGDSISLDGVCLTVVSLDDGGFCIELSPETLRRTTFGALKAGDPVNLERPLAVSDRLGGHIVQGHVDGTGTRSFLQAGGRLLYSPAVLPQAPHAIRSREGVHRG